MNFYYLNLLLGIYQFVLLLVLSPLTYRLQVGMEGGREGARAQMRRGECNLFYFT